MQNIVTEYDMDIGIRIWEVYTCVASIYNFAWILVSAKSVIHMGSDFSGFFLLFWLNDVAENRVVSTVLTLDSPSVSEHMSDDQQTIAYVRQGLLVGF